MKFDEIWEIEKFLALDTVINSQPFQAGRGIWKMKLFPLGNPGTSDKCHVAVYLQLVDLSSRKNTRSQGIYATPRFQILDEKGNKLWSQRKAGYVAKERRFVLSSHSATIFGYKRFIPRKNLVFQKPLLTDGKLILRCQLIIREGVRDVDEIPAPPEAIVDFSRLLTMRKTTAGATTNPVPSFSDVTFRLDGTEFECHKAIVSRKSPILKEFFIAYDSEVFQISSSQDFEMELKAPIFQDALLHIYGSSPKILSTPFQKFNRCWSLNVKKVLSLMLLATKYEIKDLTQICESKLIELFRARSLGLAKRVKKGGKKSGNRDSTDFFHFEDKPFSLDKMREISEHVTASCLSVYLTTCQELRAKRKRDPTAPDKPESDDSSD